MSLPNVEVVTALFESYLNIRKSGWSLNVEEPLKTPLSYKPASKMGVCVDCVITTQKATSAKVWTELAHDFIVKAQAELVKANEARNSYLWMGRFFVDRPLLLETLCAAISYVNCQLQSDQGNEQLPAADLESYKELLEKLNYLNAHNKTEDSYHQYFFDNIILARDAEAVRLEEKTFNDYENNVLNKARLHNICNKIIAEKDKPIDLTIAASSPAVQAPVEESKTTSTAKITAATALVSQGSSNLQTADPVKLPSISPFKGLDLSPVLAPSDKIKIKPTPKTKRILTTRAKQKALAKSVLLEPESPPRFSL